MLPSQSIIDAHVSQTLLTVSNFERQVITEIDSVIVDVSAHLLKTFSTSKGPIKQSPENANKILAVEDVFQSSLNSSNYYPTILAFVETFVDQVDEFDALHEGTSLSSSYLINEDRNILSHQASIAVAVLEGHSVQVVQELRQYLSRSLGDISPSSLASGACAIVRKVSRVEPLGRDQCNIWSRLLSLLIFRRVEGSGKRLRYTYVGPKTKSTRGFCSKLLAGGPLSLDKISALDNGQTSDVLLNGGGYGCNHFWFGEVVG